jgi:hypothetical protein
LREKSKGKIMENIRSKPAFEAWNIGEYASNSKEFSTKDNALPELRFLWGKLKETSSVEEYSLIMSRIDILSKLVM